MIIEVNCMWRPSEDTTIKLDLENRRAYCKYLGENEEMNILIACSSPEKPADMHICHVYNGDSFEFWKKFYADNPLAEEKKDEKRNSDKS